MKEKEKDNYLNREVYIYIYIYMLPFKSCKYERLTAVHDAHYSSYSEIICSFEQDVLKINPNEVPLGEVC